MFLHGNYDFENLEIKHADWSQGMVAIILCRIFCFPGCYPKTQGLRYKEL
jgi:hypothetical protein